MARKIRTCPKCGIRPTRGTSGWCVECAAERGRELRAAVPRKYPNCRMCEEDIAHRPKHAMFCSPECQRAFTRDLRVEQMRAAQRRYKYKLEPDDYRRMVAEQDGCAICGDDEVELVVDHDHDTGAVRQLLCRRHNVALGMFQDNPEHLMTAAAYLLRHAGGEGDLAGTA